MTTFTPYSARTQIRYARTYTEKYKHHSDCRCTTHRDSHGEGFCTPGHATWHRALDALIDQCR